MRAIVLTHTVAAVLVVSAVTPGCATRAPVEGAAGTEGVEPIDEDAPPATPWRTRRARPTRVPATSVSPWAPPALTLDETMERVRYPSGELALLAVIARPPTMPQTADTPTEKLPGVVLLHNGFALTNDTLAWARPFVDAGFAVLMPSQRGENGNPGRFELLRGEVEDVKAATRFFVDEPDVDVNRLYVFGHSAGGGLASLLALDDDVPFRIIAVSNGLYAAGTFTRWKQDDPKKVPFDVAGPQGLEERTVRALVPNAHELAHPLTIIVGDADQWVLAHTKTVQARAPAHLVTVHVVKGDHMGSLPAALEKFRALVVADAFRAQPAPRVSAREPLPSRASRSAP